MRGCCVGAWRPRDRDREGFLTHRCEAHPATIGCRSDSPVPAARSTWGHEIRPHGTSVAMLACVATGVEMDSHRGATGTHRPLAWAGTDASWRESHEAAPSFGPYRHKEPVLAESVFNAPLSEVDPEIAAVLEHELGRQRDYLEMIASENFVPVSVLQSQGSRAHQQVRRGLPRPPLLRRLRVRRRRRVARHRAREVAVRRRVRERAAALGRHRQRGRAVGDRHARRHHPRPRARPRRPPHPRHEAQLLGQALQRRRLRRRPRDVPAST